MSIDLYTVWTDGSYRNRKVGAGWLYHHGEERKDGLASIQLLHGNDIPHGSDIAEVFAVVQALQNIPANAVVQLNTDCKNVAEWLDRKALSSKKFVPSLTRYFEQAVELIADLNHFSAAKISSKNFYLGHVHNLSRVASSPDRKPI